MSVLKIEQIDFSNISVDTPIKQDGLYLSKIKYNEKDLIIQTPKLKIVSYSEDTIVVKIPDSFKTFLEYYDNRMILLTSEHSQEWFSKDLSKIKVTQIYKSSSVTCDQVTTASFKIDENIKVYSAEKTLTQDDLVEGLEVIILLQASYLVFYKANCIPYFNTIQIKIKAKKPVYEFREVEEPSKKVPIKLNLAEFDFN